MKREKRLQAAQRLTFESPMPDASISSNEMYEESLAHEFTLLFVPIRLGPGILLQLGTVDILDIS